MHKLTTKKEAVNINANDGGRHSGGRRVERLTVRKPEDFSGTEAFPRSLDALLVRDGLRGVRRRIDGTPPLWNQVRENLLQLDPPDLVTVASNVMYSMCDHPSGQWALLLLDVVLEAHQNRNLPFPDGLLSGALRHCAGSRADVYAVIEMLHMVDSSGGLLKLSSADWKQACNAAIQSMSQEIPSASSQDAFYHVS